MATSLLPLYSLPGSIASFTDHFERRRGSLVRRGYLQPNRLLVVFGPKVIYYL